MAEIGKPEKRRVLVPHELPTVTPREPAPKTEPPQTEPAIPERREKEPV